jgi:hypothetical protein
LPEAGGSPTPYECGNRERKDVSGQSSTEYVYFNGEVIAEKNTLTEDWSEYVYANGKRIAKAVDFEDRILIQGTNCSGCGSQYTGFTINGIAWLPYVIQSGDRVMLRQKTNSGQGGVVLYFSDGSSTRNVAMDSDGQLLNADGMIGYFHYRTADLSAYAGKTLSSIAVISETTSGVGSWLLKYADFVPSSSTERKLSKTRYIHQNNHNSNRSPQNEADLVLCVRFGSRLELLHFWFGAGRLSAD